MNERKNINKLFQEKFENLEVAPDENVWENIESKLKEKKKRRVIPFWWKLSGIAAALLVELIVYNYDSKTTLDTENGIANQKNGNTKNNDNSVNKTSDKTKNIVEANVANSKDTIEVNFQNIVVSNNNSKTNSNVIDKAVVGFKTIKNKTNAIARIKNDSEDKIAVQSYKDKKGKQKKASFLTEKIVVVNNASSIINNNDKNNSVLNANIKTAETINKKMDSTIIAIVEPNALEELLKEKESKSITEPKLNRWQVSSNVAPIYFSSISNGSPLDNALKENKKSYTANNQSYGIGVNYALNKKLKIRTGVNLLNIDYNTNGIVYYQNQSVNGKLNHLSPNMIGNTIIIENLNSVNTPFSKLFQKSEGSLNQKLGYIEMPLEITYSVLNKKIGIDFIGGMSTMILNKNEIFLQSSELNLKIGEANNLNSVHFSGNIGLGFKYDIFRRLEARIEPVFKYQINTFSNDSGNFKPYVFGVYSGINFTF
jgi:hypothetical protein